MNNGYEIDIYATETGKEPYSEWKDALDEETLARIDIRLTRIRHNGHFGDFDSVGQGVYELRFHFGPGYRIYFGYGKDKKQLVILLAGGTKRHQSRDVKKAQMYWKDHLSMQRRKS